MESFVLPDVGTGICLLVPSQIALGPATTEAHFRATQQGQASNITTPNAGYNWYRLAGQLLIDGDPFTVKLCFAQGSLWGLSMSIDTGGQSTSWSSWSEAAELATNRRHQEILERHYGPPPYTYPWGWVSASYDPRGGSSNITVRYR